MEPPINRQTRKRLATRRTISDVATRLFIERGFDQVTIDEVANAADVSRMTVFNHFARKEDLFFDLDEAVREDFLTALHTRKAGTSPVEALRLFAHWAVATDRPYVRFHAEGTDRFLATIMASEVLKARSRAIREELTDLLTEALTKSAVRMPHDPHASLAASLLVATCTVALLEAHRVFQQNRRSEEANAAFLQLVDRGVSGVRAALEGTPYTSPTPTAHQHLPPST